MSIPEETKALKTAWYGWKTKMIDSECVKQCGKGLFPDSPLSFYGVFSIINFYFTPFLYDSVTYFIHTYQTDSFPDQD